MTEATSPAIARVNAPATRSLSRMRLRGRLFLKYVALFLTVVLVALASSGAFQVWFYYQEHKVALVRIQREQAEAASARIGHFIKEIENQIGWTTQLPWSAGALGQRRFDALRLLRQVPAITEFAQLDSHGREQLRVSRFAMEVIGSQTDFSKDPKFTEAMANKVYYGPVYFRRGSEPYMTLALAGARPDAGVSVAEVNLKLIWDVISQIKVGQGGHAYVVDAQGGLIAHPDISLVLRKTDLSGLAQVQAARAAAAGAPQEGVQEAKDIHGDDVLTAYAQVAPLDWLVFVELPFEEAYAPLRVSIERLGLLLLSGLMLALFAGLFLARHMVGPIRALQAGAARLGSGDLSQRIAVTTGDELQALGDQFNEMASRLQDSYADLERKVEVRTQALGKSVRELRALGEVSRAVNSTLDLESVLSTIVAKAVQLSGTDAGAIYVTGDANELRLRATHGMSDDMIAALVARGVGFSETVVAQVVAQRAPVQIADLEDGPRTPVEEIVLNAGYRALLVVPLLSPDDIVGILVVRRRQPGQVPQSTIDLLQTFAAQSVVAIRNASLFSEVEEKRQQLAIASQHKSQFVANMSHELRTPLNAIIGYSEMLREEIEETGHGRFSADLNKIKDSGRHLLGLINDILDLSKIEAGKVDLFLEEVEIGPLLEEVRAIIKPLAEKNRNVLEIGLADAVGSMRTDRTKLKQILLNVLSNASKFTEDGTVTLRAARCDDGRPTIRFAISDTGIGMTDAQLGRLFQAFSQVDASTSQKYGGTGLGLAITRHFCQLLGGEIEAASRPGEGSTFTISLPTLTAATLPIVERAAAPIPADDEDNASTVLVVDDDAAARDLLTANLKGAGYRVVHAASGEEALALARSIRPDAITLDVLMPKMDGWAVLSALKRDAELRDIPVVMVTLVAERGIGVSLGAVDFLTKPVQRGELIAVLHRLLRRDGQVLIVEDEAATRAVIRPTIKKMGLPMVETVNGRSALRWLAENPPPAVILLDLMMPEMDGFEVLDAVAGHDKWRDIPVIVITAKQLTEAERERLRRAAHQIIVKGASIGIDVARAVGAAVRRQPAVAEEVADA